MDNPRPPANALSTMSDEQLSDYLKRRERELVQQTAAIRGTLAQKERELEQLWQAMKAIGIQRSYVEQLKPFLDQVGESLAMDDGLLNPTETCPRNILLAPLPWENPLAQAPQTIKEMILRALNDHFHQGATPSELRDYFKTAYGKEIDRNSISPQLARLREERLVQNTNALNESGKWQLSVRGSLTEAMAEIENRNVNALASSPRAKRWYGNDPKKE